MGRRFDCTILVLSDSKRIQTEHRRLSPRASETTNPTDSGKHVAGQDLFVPFRPIRRLRGPSASRKMRWERPRMSEPPPPVMDGLLWAAAAQHRAFSGRARTRWS